MIYITGDIHAHIDIGKLNTERFPQQKQLSKNDYVIVCGDFGLVWDNKKSDLYWRNWLSEKPFTTLFVDGNHENFELLYRFPTMDKFGGRVREIAPSVYHLERGQVVNIDGRTFFVMGGAESHDRQYRKEHLSWWKEEMPTKEEMERAICALDSCEWSVDYVISHCAPRSVQTMISSWYDNDPLVSFFERVSMDLRFKAWFFGHYHIDRRIDERYVALYNEIIPIC